MKKIGMIVSLVLVLSHSDLYSQSGTFDFYSGATENGASLSQTVSGVSMNVYSDHSVVPIPSMTLEDWSAFPPFTNNAGTMNGQAKPRCTFTFDHPVCISTILVSDFYGSENPHLLFSANTGATYDVTIDGYNGSVVSLRFVNITSFDITRVGGGNFCLGFDNVVMDNSLPVQLASFTATSAGSEVRLAWTTVTEVHNYGFEVERSEHGAQGYTTVPGSFVPGHGTTLEPHEYAFTDDSAPLGNVMYRLKQIDLDGTQHFSDAVHVDVSAGVREETVPAQFALQQNYPNPFNPTTTIKYQIPHSNRVTLTVVDLAGSEVRTLVSDFLQAGSYEATFDATGLASGVYMCRLQSGSAVQTRKLVLLR